VYEFDRSFPFTTVKQMELTYGMLCGIRLASSRDDAEFRETAIRDCALGYPTLTYFFPWFRKILGRVADKHLAQRFGQAGLLMKTPSSIRSGAEITKEMFKNIPLKEDAGLVAEAVKLCQSWVTFVTAGISWVLLAFAEPELGIRITNNLEMKKLAQKDALPTQVNFSGLAMGSVERNQPVFQAFQRHQQRFGA
jgi:hypothetical protein